MNLRRILRCRRVRSTPTPSRGEPALAVPYEELKQGLAAASQVHRDESPTKEANQKAWLWTSVTQLFAMFAIFSSRAGIAVPSLLGPSYAGIVNCDRAQMYWQAKRLQWCWAHLKRDFQALVDHPILKSNVSDTTCCGKSS